MADRRRDMHQTSGSPAPRQAAFGGQRLLASLVAYTLLLAACSSLPPALRFNSVYRDVNALLARNDFHGARARLEQAGVGRTPTPESLKDRDLSEARSLFEERTTQRFLAESQRLLNEGRPR